MTVVLDHLAVGTMDLGDGWGLFGGLLGGTWVYGGDSPGFWWGQLGFAAGPKIELLTPTGGPDAAFLERFLARDGAGPHHFNFVVSDIGEALARTREFGIEPVGVNLANPNWQEAFLHPRDAHGIVVQLAQQAGEPDSPPPAGLPEAGPEVVFGLIEYHVADLRGAVRLFRDVLGGQAEEESGEAADLTWPGGKRVRLVRDASLPAGGRLHSLRFTRTAGPFSAQDRERAGVLAGRLGLALDLAG